MSDMARAASGRIVVGVDGSPESKAALNWALNEARHCHAAVEAVHAWQYPAVAFSHFGGEALPLIAPGDVETAAHGLLRKTVEEISGADCDVAVTPKLARGHPAEVLLALSEDADMLVVGSRGHGGFKGMLLGSVSNHVIHHAHCPVVVVRT